MDTHHQFIAYWTCVTLNFLCQVTLHLLPFILLRALRSSHFILQPHSIIYSESTRTLNFLPREFCPSNHIFSLILNSKLSQHTATSRQCKVGSNTCNSSRSSSRSLSAVNQYRKISNLYSPQASLLKKKEGWYVDWISKPE